MQFLFLTAAVICVQVHFLLSETVILEGAVKSTLYGIGSFPTVTSFVCQEVDLSWLSLTIDTEDIALHEHEKIDWTRLLWIRREMHQLGIVEGVVDFYILRVALQVWGGGV